MKGNDILSMCLRNLFRRKARTLLTVLGVVIGCAAIVIMVSIGIGTKVAQEKMLSEMGDLTLITVTAPHSKASKVKLDKKTVAEISRLPGVEIASLKKTLELADLRIYAGSGRRFIADGISVVGLEPEAIKALGYRLENGAFPVKGDKGVLLGQYVDYNFRDTLRPDGYNMVDRYGQSGSMAAGGGDSEFAVDEGFSDAGGSELAAAANVPKPYFDAETTPLVLEAELGDQKKISFPLTVRGRLKEDYAKGFESSEGLIIPLSLLNSIEKAAGVKPNANPYSTSLIVKVTGIDKVAEVESMIKEMRLQTSSMESIRKPLEKEARQKQLMLGGLGAISLLVAAIGITNTMIMSISERAREIGIMKALGCDLRDLRLLFLAEAGTIGLLGGMIGSLVSLGISFLMNTFAAGRGGAEGMSETLFGEGGGAVGLSIVPVWLIGFAVLFSVAIGLVSGYYPANRAVRISALEAIRGE